MAKSKINVKTEVDNNNKSYSLFLCSTLFIFQKYIFIFSVIFFTSSLLLKQHFDRCCCFLQRLSPSSRSTASSSVTPERFCLLSLSLSPSKKNQNFLSIFFYLFDLGPSVKEKGKQNV